MLKHNQAALVLAPMDGITDARMRNFQGSTGAFSYAVTEFIRVSIEPLPQKVFRREVPELADNATTASGLPVQVQLLGGDGVRLATSALAAVQAGATAIDLNFGCPAPVVNRHDGGASLLKQPKRVKEVVRAVREAVPSSVPVSAKLRLGWDDIDAIHENAAMAVEGGAAWLTIHARTKVQGYAPPVFWPAISTVRAGLGVPVVANGDIWTIDDFRQCREETGCDCFMIGRGALANPGLPHQIAHELGINRPLGWDGDWKRILRGFADLPGGAPALVLTRLKQWISLSHKFGSFPYFHELKRAATVDEFFLQLETLSAGRPAQELQYCG